MRNLLALIGAALLLFVGLGWYLGWYTFALQPSADGKQRIQLDVDTDKIVEDTKKAGSRVGSVLQGEPTTPATSQTQEFVGPPLPPDMPNRGTAIEIQPPAVKFTFPTQRN